MLILCLNAGSSSLKAGRFATDRDGSEVKRVASDVVERVGQGDDSPRDHGAAFAVIVDALERDGFTPDVSIEPQANDDHAVVISPPGSRVTVRIEPTDEESMMALHAARLARHAPPRSR